MQGLSDGYFILPYTVGNYLGSQKFEKIDESHPEFEKAVAENTTQMDRILGIQGKRTVDDIHRELGKNMWEYVGMSRTAEGLQTARKNIKALKEEFWSNVLVPGKKDGINHELEKAGRVADFLELGDLMARDAFERQESCGGHFREEYQTPEHEARRDDENFSHCLLYTSPSPRDRQKSRMPSSA